MVRKKKEAPRELSEADMRKLENRASEVELAKKEAKIEKQKVEIQKLRLELFKKQIESMEQIANERVQDVEKAKSNYISVTKELQEKHSLKNKWGYDPESGEIKE